MKQAARNMLADQPCVQRACSVRAACVQRAYIRLYNAGYFMVEYIRSLH